MDQFIELTGASQKEAEFYMQAHKGDLQEALSAFYEASGESAPSGPAAQSPQAAQPSSSSSSSSREPWPASSSSSRGSKLRTLGDLGANDDHSDSEEEAQNYFAGGEKSGVMMQGAPKDKKPVAADLIKDILNKAAKAGPPQEKAKKPTYTGSGRRLGAEDAPAPPPVAASGPASQEVVERSLTFWKDGFSIEDGPLMRYDDPANQEVLASINSGQGPTALFNVTPNQQVDVKISHRLNENYVPTKKPTPAFSGSGHRLGVSLPDTPAPSGAPQLIGAYPGSSSVTAQAPAPALSPSFAVDMNLPVTSIQVRLADGTRLVVKMNHHHTVGDIRNFINHSRPGQAGQPFALQATFPNRTLEDDSLTVKDAGLLNSVIVQKRS
ncbi:hypothetical protein DFJ73DRAFT_843047 [Zopfochytrium polystomum]|nr:hypothetical protein DFJ73DRAFT_843047 [Zopfochytrium polystomum]